MKEEKKYHIVYQTKNMVNGKLYIGVHSTDNVNDGYIGCGIRTQGNASSKKKTSPFIKAVRKYGIQNFKREILDIFDSKAEAYEEEKFLVDQKWVESSNTYNVSLGGNENKQYKGSLLRSAHASSKKVINKLTGEVYDSVQTVSELINMNNSTLLNKLKGRCFNDTDYEMVDPPEGYDRLITPNNIKYIDINQYDINGVYIKSYNNLTEVPYSIRSNVLTTLTNKSNRRVIAGNSFWTAYNIETGKIQNEDFRKHFKYTLKEINGTQIHFLKLVNIASFLGNSSNSTSRLKSYIGTSKRIKGIYKLEYYENKKTH